MAENSQSIKYVKLDDGVSFSLVRTNPKLTTNTKLMYNGKKMYMESYASSELLNRSEYKNVSVKQNSIFNKDIASFLTGSGSQAYSVHQNFSDITISDSYDNQFETLYWCGAEYIDSYFYNEEIGFVAPLYLREKLPNYFVIFRLDTPSNYNLTVDGNGVIKDSEFNFKTDILDKAVLIKTFDLREGSVLGNYIHRYVEQDGFEFDKSMYVNFSNAEVTYYGIDKNSGVLEKRVESFENELLKNDEPVLKDDKWFTEGFERNGLIFPYIMNIEYLFDDDNFKHNGEETYDFARYIGVYCNNIEFGEFADLSELKVTEDNAIYYFEDNNSVLHRYSKYSKKSAGEDSDSDSDRDTEYIISIDGKDVNEFDNSLISGFEKDRITGYGEPLDIYEGFINRAQYGFEILKPLEPGDWVGIEYEGKIECYFADDIKSNIGIEFEVSEQFSNFRFLVKDGDTVNDIAEALARSVNRNKDSKFEAKSSDNVVVFYAKREGQEYNGSETGGAKMLMDATLIYNKKISMPISNNISLVSEDEYPIYVGEVASSSPDSDINTTLFGDYYKDYFCGACDVEINLKNDTYKNIFKIYIDEYIFFDINRYLKTNNGDGRRISTNMIYINSEGKIDHEYRLVIVDNVPEDKVKNVGYEVSVSSTYQVEIMDPFKPNHGVLSWFPVKDFDFDINYSTYGQYTAFAEECNILSKKIVYTFNGETIDDDDYNGYDNALETEIQKLAKSAFTDDSGDNLASEYSYYFEQYHPDLCLMSKTTPYIAKWGYYDEQKDSCENPYRLNVNKVFGVSNLSANTYLRKCDENEYTHGMPYYMTLNTPDYQKNYQYIKSDEIYSTHPDSNAIEQYSISEDDGEHNTFESFADCVDYWINMFMDTDKDWFSYFFSGKKYGKRFDRKYSRLLGGDKLHNPSTLFRGVKFEAVRQYIGVEKRTSEYNDYKFSFVYIPVMLNDMSFNSTVYFIKNDTFKFIVGIVFVNTMLGAYGHNIFNGNTNYFNKGFLYAACKDIIKVQGSDLFEYGLKFDTVDDNNLVDTTSSNSFWKDKINSTLYMWRLVGDSNTVLVTTTKSVKKGDVVGEFSENDSIESIVKIKDNVITDIKMEDANTFTSFWNQYYEEYDATIHKKSQYKYYGTITCSLDNSTLDFKNNRLIDTCDIEWDYIGYDKNNIGYGYRVDVSNLYFKSESIKNILINLGSEDSVTKIHFKWDGGERVFPDPIYPDGYRIKVDYEVGYITIESKKEVINDNSDSDFDQEFEYINMPVILNGTGEGDNIENLKVDIQITDRFDSHSESLAMRNYFSVFERVTAYNISECINNDYNVKYYSTVEDNKYKIRVIEPDSIEIKDLFEAVPVEITQNNKSVVGSLEIKEKQDVDKIGIMTINRYSGFYSPIFNDILYYDDYTYTKTVGRLGSNLFELPYSNTYIDYDYNDGYGEFGVIKNLYYHKTNTTQSDKILTSQKPVYPAINEYALDYRNYNIFSSSWDEGYFISQDDLNSCSYCNGIGSMKDGLCMFGSKYLNLPDYIFVDTFENGKLWDEKIVLNDRDNTDVEIIYKEINDRTVSYHLFLEKRLKRYLVERLYNVFSKYINKNYSFGDKSTIDDDVEEYVEKNLLKLYKVDRVYMYIKEDMMRTNNRKIENEYLKYMTLANTDKIKVGFPFTSVGDGVMLKDSKFIMLKTNEFDRNVTYNLKPGFKESFGFGVSFRRK